MIVFKNSKKYYFYHIFLTINSWFVILITQKNILLNLSNAELFNISMLILMIPLTILQIIRILNGNLIITSKYIRIIGFLPKKILISQIDYLSIEENQINIKKKNRMYKSSIELKDYKVSEIKNIKDEFKIIEQNINKQNLKLE